MMSESRVMRLGDKPDWQTNMETESIDMECFLEHVHPDWKEKYSMIEDGHLYYDRERAFYDHCEMMTPIEFKKALDESGCRET